MPKNFLQRFMPDPQWLKEHKRLARLEHLLHDPQLWHLNRKSVPRSFSIGVFFAFMPFPFHMLFAAICSIYFRANLPLSVTLVWITNPLTMPPIYYFAYVVGAHILHSPPTTMHFEVSMSFLSAEFEAVWRPFVLGSFVLGVAFAIVCNIAIRLIWRLSVVKRWRARVAARRAHAEFSNKSD